jgi:hypothetical protein
MWFYATCIRSGYREILPRIEAFIAGFGRMLYLERIFRALIETDWTREHARRIFEQVRDRHHAITIHVIENLLKKAGL